MAKRGPVLTRQAAGLKLRDPMTRNGIRGEFGEQVRKQRQSLGLSQEGLAERSGLHRTYISDLERGARNVSLETIARIAAGLDLAIRDLFP